MSTQLQVVETPRRPDRIQVVDAIPVLDTGRFEQMQRIATVMARSGLIPDTLCTEGNGDNKELLPLDVVVARCFLIVNQSVGWRMDPFAVAQCASVVHGRVCYEGKLISAVLDNMLGVRLSYAWNDKAGDALAVTVTGTVPGETTPRTITGTVGEWKTTGKNSPWPKQPRMLLAYRGARDWARLHAPAAMLGVYTPDELDDAVERQHRLPPAPPPPPAIAAPMASIPAPSPHAQAATVAPDPPKAAVPPPPPPPPPRSIEPPKPPAPAPPPADEFDFDAFRKALDDAPDEAALNAGFDQWVTNRAPPLSADEADEADVIMREIAAKFWTEDGAQ